MLRCAQPMVVARRRVVAYEREHVQEQVAELQARLRATEATCQSLAQQLYTSTARTTDLEGRLDLAQEHIHQYECTGARVPRPPC